MKRALLSLILISNYCAASSWDDIRFKGLEPGHTYSIDIGTGFFVNSEMIVTNKHVVSDCANIAVRGATQPQLVVLYAKDNQLDLALLKANIPSKNVPYIRNNYTEVKKDDMLFSIGYPLEKGESGEYVIKEAKVIDVTKYDDTKFTKIEFTDSVEHGNSGGPLLDKNSNLVGVVTAKITYYIPGQTAIPKRTVAMAIGVDGLQEFLKRNNIPYASSSTYDIFTNYHVDKLTRDYVVNIHCIKR